MADQLFNISKGRHAEFHARVDGSDPTNAALVVLLLSAAEADATLIDYDTVAALLAGSNTEATFTNYARKVLTDADVSAITVDDSGNLVSAQIADQTWTSAGGASNNTIVKAIVAYDPDTTGGTDTALVPISHHDVSITTNGSDLVLSFGDGYYARST